MATLHCNPNTNRIRQISPTITHIVNYSAYRDTAAEMFLERQMHSFSAVLLQCMGSLWRRQLQYKNTIITVMPGWSPPWWLSGDRIPVKYSLSTLFKFYEMYLDTYLFCIFFQIKDNFFSLCIMYLLLSVVNCCFIVNNKFIIVPLKTYLLIITRFFPWLPHPLCAPLTPTTKCMYLLLSAFYILLSPRGKVFLKPVFVIRTSHKYNVFLRIHNIFN